MSPRSTLAAALLVIVAVLSAPDLALRLDLELATFEDGSGRVSWCMPGSACSEELAP
jgi:hypothetical protein